MALKINKECIHCPFILLLSTLLCNEQLTAATIFLAPNEVSNCKLYCSTNRNSKNLRNFSTIIPYHSWADVICLVGSRLVVMKRQPGFSLIHVLKYLQEQQYNLIIAKLMIEKVICGISICYTVNRDIIRNTLNQTSKRRCMQNK